ncbi:glutamine synthetase family protein [Hyphomicrobium sp. ghe19]|uniref:glutamine synthetase family protein n=1 Tax=Hyphomicrobium sp. ghe19 TaxID=2682968 RepID=UPI0013677AD2|nr:Glutamate--isopropylamine ligase [Hyphomicrobium sp. ghe19]
MNIQDVRELIASEKINTVIIAATDAAGVLRGKRLTVPYFYHAIEDGLHFASFLLGTTTMDEVLPGLFDTGIPDVKGMIDLSTFRVAPWEANTAIVFMDWATPEGSPHPLCPRSMLKRKVAEAKAMGFSSSASLELEFYLLPISMAEVRKGRWSDIEPASRDIHCYSILEGHYWEPIIGKLRECFPNEIEGCLPEWGQGQFEVNLHHSDPVKMADASVMLKLATKQLASQAGAMATFMAKFREDLSGCSGHIHMSLQKTVSKEPVFFDADKPLRLSDTFKNFVAGNIDVFAPSMIFYAPNVNSYKRLQSMTFAGTTRNWAVDNRTTGFRAINATPRSTRLEVRMAGADVNPYYGLSIALGSGLRGIRLGLIPPPPSSGNAYDENVDKVPATLSAAVRCAASDKGIREVLSPEVVDNALRIADFELGVFERTVTDLERRRYMETV